MTVCLYIPAFDPKTVDPYAYIPLIPRLWICTSLISRLGAVAGAVVGIAPYSYGFDPKTVDLEVHIFQLVKFLNASGFGGLLWFANLCCGSVASRGVSICDGHCMCAFVSCVLIHLPWFHNRALTLTDNSGQTDMFLGQQKCPIVPAQLIRQLLSSKMIDTSADLFDVTDMLFIFLYVGGCTVVSQPCVGFEG